MNLSAPARSVPARSCAANIVIREEVARDVFAREILLDKAFGLNRARKSSERLRENRLPAEGLAFTAVRGCVLVGTLRLWDIDIGNGAKALLLGPIAVASSTRGKGLGARMIRMALDKAKSLGCEAVLLVGDAPYYARFGFSREKMAGLDMPGPVETARFLGLELRAGALDGARGVLRASGRLAPGVERRRAA